MKSICFPCLLLSILAESSVLAQTSFTDTEFVQTDWEVLPYVLPEANKAGQTSSEQIPSGGNPGAFQRVSHTIPPIGVATEIAYIGEYHINPRFSIPARSISAICSINFAIDTRVPSTERRPVGCGFVIRQGTIYHLVAYAIQTSEVWSHFTASLPIANLPTDLSFGEGAPKIEFGFFTANSLDGGPRDGYSASIGLDNFRVAVVSGHASESLTVEIHPAAEICWISSQGTPYQIQWANSPDAIDWNNLGDAILGTGSKLCVFDSTLGVPRRFYKVRVCP